MGTPGLSGVWDQNRVNSALYIAFWSVEPTDFKNVIVENIPPALSLFWPACLWGSIFNDCIFEISGFHWLKCNVECSICLTLIFKSSQARFVYFCLISSISFDGKSSHLNLLLNLPFQNNAPTPQNLLVEKGCLTV